MRCINFKFLYLATLCVYGLGLLSTINAEEKSAQMPVAAVIPAGLSKGAYLAKIGDCISCHSAPGGKPYAGGLAINSPFGTIYSTNITPDSTYGIGSYTLQDFSRALREGVAKDGHRLYPAMPYPSYTATSDEDIAALYDFFMHEVAPVHEQPHATELSFPFNQRWGIVFWDIAFNPDARFKPQADKDEQWNRGAYLALSLGHCSACHSPRGLAYEETSPHSRAFLRGEILDNWAAADLRGDKASGLGTWSEQDIAAFLKTGHGAGTAAFGNMTQVIENSTQYLSAQDAAAIAHYLKSLSPGGEQATYNAKDIKEDSAYPNEKPGAGMYAVSCAMCHQPDGAGKLPRFPKLAGNPAVLSENPTSLIRIVLEGGRSAHTDNGPAPQAMPAFGKKYSDEEIAQLVTFIRQRWGNHAQSVDTREVAGVRNALKE